MRKRLQDGVGARPVLGNALAGEDCISIAQDVGVLHNAHLLEACKRLLRELAIAHKAIAAKPSWT